MILYKTLAHHSERLFGSGRRNGGICNIQAGSGSHDRGGNDMA